MSLADIKNKLISAVTSYAKLNAPKIDPTLVKNLQDKGAAVYDISGNLDLNASQQKLKDIEVKKAVPVSVSGLPKVTTVKNLAPTVQAQAAVQAGDKLQVLPSQPQQTVFSPSFTGQQAVQKSISNAYEAEKPVTAKVPFLPGSINLQGPNASPEARFLAETASAIIEWPEKIIRTLQDANLVKEKLFQTNSITEAGDVIKPIDPEDETKLNSYLQDYKKMVSSDPYFMNHPVQAYALIGSQAVLDIAGLGAGFKSLLNKQLSKLPKNLANVTESKLKLGIDLDGALDEKAIDTAYRKIAQVVHPDKQTGSTIKRLVKTTDGYEMLTPFEEATKAREYLKGQLVNGEIPAVSSFDRKYADVLEKMNDDIRNWFSQPVKSGNVSTKGLLPQRAGMKPVNMAEARQPSVGLSTREVREVPVKVPEISGGVKQDAFEDFLQSSTQEIKKYNRPEVLKQAESFVDKTVDKFRKEIGMLAGKEGKIGVRTNIIKDAVGNTEFVAENFKMQRAKNDLYRQAQNNKKYAYDLLYENDDSFRKIVDTIADYEKGNEIDVKQLNGLVTKMKNKVSFEEEVTRMAKQQVFKAEKKTPAQLIKASTDKRIPEKVFNKTEKQLLVDRIKAQKSIAPVIKRLDRQAMQRQASAYKRQIERTRKSTRTEVIKSFKDKNNNVQDIKNKITAFVTDFLPQKERGKFLVNVRDAKTKGDLASTMLKIDATQRAVKATSIKENIKKLSDKAENLPLETRKKITAFLDKYSSSKMRASTVENLKDTKEWYGASNINLPYKLKMRLEKAEKIPLVNLKNDRLEEIESNLLKMVEEGKQQAKINKEFEEIVLKTKLDKISKDIKNYDKEILKRTPGEKLNTKLAITRKKQVIADLIQTGDWEKTFAERFIDMLDGNKGYSGTLYNFLYKPVKRSSDAWMNLKDDIEERFITLNKKLKLDFYDAEKIAVHAYRLQPSGMEKLLSAGYGEKFINSVKLNEKQMEMYKFMRAELDKLEPKIAETYAANYQEMLGHIDDYFPMHTDLEQEVPLSDQIKKSYNRSTTEKSFTKARTGAEKPLKLDAFDIFLKHVDNASYFINMDKTVKEIGKIVNSDQFLETVGNKATKYLRQWIDVISRKGGVANQERHEVFTFLRRNNSIGMLGFKLSSMLYQFTAKFNAFAEIGTWAMRYDKDFATKPEIRKFVYKTSAEIRNRAGGDPAFLNLAENKYLKYIQQKSLAPMQKIDSVLAANVWFNAYRKKLKELNIPFEVEKVNEEALDYADRVIRLTMSSGQFKDLPPMFVNKKRDITKTFFQFQNVMMNNFDYIKHDLVRINVASAKDIAKISDPKTKTEEKVKLINRISIQLIGLISGIAAEEALQTSMSYLYYGKDFDTTSKHVISAIMSKIPGLSQLYSTLEFEQVPLPILAPIQNVIKAKQAFEGKTKASSIKGYSYLLDAVGTSLGIPVGEVTKIMRGTAGRKKKIKEYKF